jgi:hypothetical protein
MPTCIVRCSVCLFFFPSFRWLYSPFHLQPEAQSPCLVENAETRAPLMEEAAERVGIETAAGEKSAPSPTFFSCLFLLSFFVDVRIFCVCPGSARSEREAGAHLMSREHHLRVRSKYLM